MILDIWDYGMQLTACPGQIPAVAMCHLNAISTSIQRLYGGIGILSHTVYIAGTLTGLE